MKAEITQKNKFFKKIKWTENHQEQKQYLKSAAAYSIGFLFIYLFIFGCLNIRSTAASRFLSFPVNDLH